MSANDNFSLHDDEELSLHDDASLNGSEPIMRSGKGFEWQLKEAESTKARMVYTVVLPPFHTDSNRRFHGMDDAKADLGCYQDKESWETKGMIGFKKLLSRVGCPLVLVCQMKMANHKFLGPSSAWDSLAMTMRTKKNIDTLSIDDLYNNLRAKASSSKHKPHHNSGSYSSYTTSSSKATPTATPGLADEVIHSFLATNADDVDLIHED
ncbi:hypothetical protein Tco_0685043 [Tanacetum coccineum]